MFGKKNNKKTTRSTRTSTRTTSVPMFEALENREMFSASPFAVSFAAVAGSNPAALNMNVTASKGADSLAVYQSGKTVTIQDNGYQTSYTGNFASITVHGNGGSDTLVVEKSVTDKVNLYGDTGNDLLVTGASNDMLCAGSGRTTMIALGGKNNKLYAGKGYDNVWDTIGNTVTKGAGTLVIHGISGFINTGDVSLDGSTFKEPAVDTQTQDTAGWVNVNSYNLPLFSSAGPQLDDINQGEIGTCYFISSLGEIAMQSQQHIRNIITPLGDGTYAEQFVDRYNGKTYFVRVDGYIPVSESALEQGQVQPEYEHLGQGGSTWAMLEEKGWAYFRAMENGKAPSFGYAEGGTGEEALYCLGGTNVAFTDSPQSNFANGNDELAWIDSQLTAGKAVEIGISKEVTGQLCGGHEYSVVEVDYNWDGSIAGIWLRNPWGVDTEQGTIASAGHNDGYNDGYVFISASTIYAVANDLASANV